MDDREIRTKFNKVNERLEALEKFQANVGIENFEVTKSAAEIMLVTEAQDAFIIFIRDNHPDVFKAAQDAVSGRRVIYGEGKEKA